MNIIKPMLCSKTEEKLISHFEKGKWIASRKYDGTRAVAIKQDGKIILEGRSGKQYQSKFPEIVDWLKNDFIPDGTILDGEICCDTFGHTQSRTLTADKFKIMKLEKLHPATFFVFDIIAEGYNDLADSEDLSGSSLWERQETLKGLIDKGNKIIDGWCALNSVLRVENSSNIRQMWEKAQELKWEGIVIKYENSTYQEGKRSKEWLKLKCVKSRDIEFTTYTTNNAGVRAVSDDGIVCQVSGHHSKKFLEIFELKGKAVVEVEYLEQFESGMLRMPVCKEVKDVGVVGEKQEVLKW